MSNTSSLYGTRNPSPLRTSSTAASRASLFLTSSSRFSSILVAPMMSPLPQKKISMPDQSPLLRPETVNEITAEEPGSCVSNRQAHRP